MFYIFYHIIIYKIFQDGLSFTLVILKAVKVELTISLCMVRQLKFGKVNVFQYLFYFQSASGKSDLELKLSISSSHSLSGTLFLKSGCLTHKAETAL